MSLHTQESVSQDIQLGVVGLTNCQVRDNFDGKIVSADGWEPNLLGVDEQWTPYGYQKVNLRKELTNFTQKWAEKERSGVVSEEN